MAKLDRRCALLRAQANNSRPLPDVSEEEVKNNEEKDRGGRE